MKLFRNAGLRAGLLLAPEDGTGGGAAPAGGDGAAPAGGTGGGDPPAFVPPEFLPEHLRGKDAGETLGKIATDWKAQRDALAQRQPAKPETADAYSFTPADDLKPLFGEDLTKDPVIAAARVAAHKHGLSNDQFAGFLNDVVGEAKKAGLIAPSDPAVEYEKEWPQLVPADKANLPEAERKAAAKARHDTAQLFADTLKARGEIDEGMHSEFSILLETAAGVRLIEFMQQNLTAEKGIVFGGGQPAGGYTMADYNRDSEDPRFSSTSTKYDPAFRAEIEAKAKHLWK